MKSREIERFIEDRIKRCRLLEVFGEISVRAGKRRVRIDSTRLIREDRDSR